LTFAEAAERTTRSDSGRSRVAIIDRGKVPAERLHPTSAYSRCRPQAELQGARFTAAKAPFNAVKPAMWTVAGYSDRSNSRPRVPVWQVHAAGDVVVRQPHNHEVALMDELSALTLAARGLVYDVPVQGPRALNRVTEGP
jgi:hypothetical protein